MSAKNLLTVKEVATYLRFSKSTIYRYIRGREIPFIKINFRIRFNPSELESWIQNQSFKTMNDFL